MDSKSVWWAHQNGEPINLTVIDIAFSCYPVTDLKRARQFYEEVLGLQESQFFGEKNIGFVEYDIGSSPLGIGNGAPTGINPEGVVRWLWSG